MTPRTVSVLPIPRGRAAQLSIGMWSLSIDAEELPALLITAATAARVLGAGPGPDDSADDTI